MSRVKPWPELIRARLRVAERIARETEAREAALRYRVIATKASPEKAAEYLEKAAACDKIANGKGRE